MFRNFIILAYRHFVRSPLTSFIELFGMTSGLTVFLLAIIWIFNETSYDAFNENADRIYRVEYTMDNNEKSSLVSNAIAPEVKSKLPEVENAVRFRILTRKATFSLVDDPNAEIHKMGYKIYADPSFFDIFSFEFIAGDPKTALSKKHTTVITESLANTVFGNASSAMGKVAYFHIGLKQATITGVIKDRPNFHIPFQMLISIESLTDHAEYKERGLNSWDGWWNLPTYLLLKENQNIPPLQSKITSLVEEHRDQIRQRRNRSENISFNLRPLRDIYFNGSDASGENYAIHGDKNKLLAYGSIAIFTLLLACINFINLNHAKSLERAREVGIKKVSGASRTNIFIQFLGEAVLVCIAAMILSIIFTHTILPQFNVLMGSNLSIGRLFEFDTLLSMTVGIVFVSLLSGGFPALFISSFQPIQAVKGIQTKKRKGIDYNKMGLTIQFVMAMLLIIGSIAIYLQVDYMKNANLGFDKEQLVTFPFSLREFPVEAKSIKTRLTSNPRILNVSHCFATPGHRKVSDSNFEPVNYNGQQFQVSVALVDEDYQKTLGLKVLQGSFFDGRPSDQLWLIDKTKSNNHTLNVVLNETAVKSLGMTNPIGETISDSHGKMKIIGVVKDFHLASLDKLIIPRIFICTDVRFQMIARISPVDRDETLAFISEEMASITGKPTTLSFLDDQLNLQYGDDEKFAKLIGYFTLIAIIIAAMGLLGVASHAIKIRIKEIGIRKTMGASSLQILSLLMGGFIKIVLLASVIAIPTGWVLTNNWLDNYAYHTEINWVVYAAAFFATLFVAVCTIIWQSWQASSMNPARLIRYE